MIVTCQVHQPNPCPEIRIDEYDNLRNGPDKMGNQICLHGTTMSMETDGWVIYCWGTCLEAGHLSLQPFDVQSVKWLRPIDFKVVSSCHWQAAYKWANHDTRQELWNRIR